MQKKPKYYYEEYWRSRISSGENFWHGLFEGEPIKRESIILAPTIINSYSNQHESAWAVYPNVHSALGFLQYMYLPTAYMGLLKKSELEYRYFFQENFIHVLHQFKEEKPNLQGLIVKMEELYKQLDDCWKVSEEACLEILRNWTLSFNQTWYQERGIQLSVSLFQSPLEAAQFIIEVYEEDLNIQMLEEDLGISKEDFLKLASDDIYSNDFMKHKFTDILTNKLIISF